MASVGVPSRSQVSSAWFISRGGGRLGHPQHTLSHPDLVKFPQVRSHLTLSHHVCPAQGPAERVGRLADYKDVITGADPFAEDRFQPSDAGVDCRFLSLHRWSAPGPVIATSNKVDAYTLLLLREQWTSSPAQRFQVLPHRKQLPPPYPSPGHLGATTDHAPLAVARAVTFV